MPLGHVWLMSHPFRLIPLSPSSFLVRTKKYISTLFVLVYLSPKGFFLQLKSRSDFIAGYFTSFS
jgi:hypothetical protein